ncbi:hypothetical protein F5B22DRAFT_655255 [Xylaria bambusicola]|uniref:uncharacterized protein n=1 Tax=Xylaria bambusicola TaxID=326684 RepID=UPI00200860E0|nr:uncharacterized protein F5B22DRAFT_655255 [Xylaria bambusicola]KAI0516981.1 hypothetical protein F5B22DRAFT_655255 [Xylaria bambusicola]
MENFPKHIDQALPVLGKVSTQPRARDNVKRATHLSLPKLITQTRKGTEPVRIPTPQVSHFMNVMALYPPEPAASLPLIISPTSPTSKSFIKACGEVVPDPYLTDIPTPITIQFTEAEAEELEQWREIVGGMRDAHSEALDQFMDNPYDTEIRKRVRKLRTEREQKAVAMAQIHERRQIRKAFRKDFNDFLPGW